MRRNRFWIERCFTPIVIILSFAPLSPQRALGSSLASMTIEQMARASSLIVRAQCVENSATMDSGEIWTFTKFRVLETWRGSAGSEITVRLLGGTFGNLTSTVSGVPRFRPGEDVVLFLQRMPDGNYSVVSWMQGTFRIRSNTRGTEAIVSQDTAAFPTFNPANHRYEVHGIRGVPVAAFRIQVASAISATENSR